MIEINILYPGKYAVFVNDKIVFSHMNKEKCDEWVKVNITDKEKNLSERFSNLDNAFDKI